MIGPAVDNIRYYTANFRERAVIKAQREALSEVGPWVRMLSLAGPKSQIWAPLLLFGSTWARLASQTSASHSVLVTARSSDWPISSSLAPKNRARDRNRHDPPDTERANEQARAPLCGRIRAITGPHFNADEITSWREEASTLTLATESLAGDRLFHAKQWKSHQDAP